MSRRTSRAQKFLSGFDRLESRCLMSNSAFVIGQIAQEGDFVGSDASVGADGIADVHLSISSLMTRSLGSDHDLNRIETADIIGTRSNDPSHPLRWRFGDNPLGFPIAEVQRVHQSGNFFPYLLDNVVANGDIYFGLNQTRTTLSSLSITLYYHGGDTQTASLTQPQLNTLNGFDPNLAAAGETIPANVLVPTPGGHAQFVGKYDTEGDNPTHEKGDGHILLDALPAGYGFDNIVEAYLTDGIGTQNGPGEVGRILRGNTTWSWKNSAQYPRVDADDLQLRVQRSSTVVADLMFPPIRNEANTQMTLRLVLQNNTGRSSIYTQFQGGSTPIELRDRDYKHDAPIVAVSVSSSDSKQIQ